MAKNLSLNGVYIAGKTHRNTVGCRLHRRAYFEHREHQDFPDAVYDGRFLTPSLCHPHIRLDKCFLLSHPKYSDLEIDNGDFAEAMKLTSQAKSRFALDDLLERGRALIEESIGFGVTHMRAFVEVDQTVGMKCLDAGIGLREEFKDRCHVQICAFAQDPIYPQDDGGKEMLHLIEEAAGRKGVDVIGSKSYVENALVNQHANIEWMIGLALKYSLHLDFHLDCNLDVKNEPSVYHVIQELGKANWTSQRVITLGHCTRLTLFSATEWQELRDRIGELPISFVGLPTSDVFMMGRPHEEAGGGERFRGTLQVPQMIKRYGLQAALGVNNVGNAFTPQGGCDPLSVASLGMGIYQAGTKTDAKILLVRFGRGHDTYIRYDTDTMYQQCVSSRARTAIGLGPRIDIELMKAILLISWPLGQLMVIKT